MPVEVTITAEITSFAEIAPYSKERKMQEDADGGLVLYKVPAYKVRIEGGSEYEAVRFGLVNNGVLPPPRDRKCDAGLSQAYESIPGWIPNYAPHSFMGTGRRGAWQIKPNQGYLIHEGADRDKTGAGGSLGCIEILDGKWNDFLSEIEALGGGVDCAKIAQTRGLKVVIEAAPVPWAALVTYDEPPLRPPPWPFLP
jgi:hypothetical protein